MEYQPCILIPYLTWKNPNSMSLTISLNNLSVYLKNGVINTIRYFRDNDEVEANIEETKLLVCDEPRLNAFKYYELYLATGGDVIAKYGRIGRAPTVFLYEKGGRSMMVKKFSEKLGKGYQVFTEKDYENKVGLVHNQIV